MNKEYIYANEAYELERTTGEKYSTNKDSWTGKIALAYPSDFGYAVDFNSCSVQLGEYNTCGSWLKSLFRLTDSGASWLLTPLPAPDMSFAIYDGSLYGIDAYVVSSSAVVPVLYLQSGISVKDGNGSMNSPYQILVD